MNMSQHFQFIFMTVLLCCVIIKGNIHGVLVNKRACRGGPAHFNATGGTITSPLHPHGPPTQVSCLWTLHNPLGDTLILSFSIFDLDQDTRCGKRSKECCPHQWLQIKTESHSARSRRDIPHGQANKKKNKTNNSHRKSTEVEYGNQDPKGSEAMAMKRKSFDLLRSLFFNDTRGDLLTAKTSPRQKSHEESDPIVHITSLENKKIEKGKSTGRICGTSPPQPIITKEPRVAIKFYSDKLVEPGHLGFSIQYQISNNLTVCNSEEFMCIDPQLCIPKMWKCNGQVECPDASDESDCQAGCAGLADNEHCDGRWQCANGEDELGCFGCEDDEWWCGEGTDCYKATGRCDGISNCQNRADEVYCNCFNQTRCGPNSEFCFDPKTQRCDGILHCPNGNDEMDCGGHCHHMIPCSHGGVCYTSAQRCDGVSQCGDGSDEASCTPQLCHPQHGAYLCANHRCIRDIWLCDRFDDCGDESDEVDCLRNSVIVAAAMGGLVCSLLLVIAVGCTCRLYALRMGLTRYRQQGGPSSGRRSTPLAPLSRLEQHLLQREPPPSYAVAVNDPAAALYGSRRLSRPWRRQLRRVPPPPEGVLPSVPVPMRGHVAPGLPHTYDTGPGHTSNLHNFTGGNNGRRSSRSSDEKESEEEAKSLTVDPIPHTSAHQHRLPLNIVDDDVPLLSAVDDEIDDRDDAPLLEVTSTSEDSVDEGDNEDDDDILLAVTVGSEALESEDSDLEGRAVEAEVRTCGAVEWNQRNGQRMSQSPLSSSSIAMEDSTIGQGHLMQFCDNGTGESASLVEEECIPSTADETLASDELDVRNDEAYLDPGTPDSTHFFGDVMTDTRAAVLALSIVQRHTNDAQQADTELISQ